MPKLKWNFFQLAYEKQKGNMEKFLSSGSSDQNKIRNAEKELNKMKSAILKVENLQNECLKPGKGIISLIIF